MTNSKQITLTDIPYQDDLLLAFFSCIEQEPWAMLLHSAAEDHCNSRFSILVADPIATITHQAGKNTITYQSGESETNEDDPFQALENLQSSLLSPLTENDTWPFLGGAVGYFGYELGRQLDTLATPCHNELFAPDMAIGIYDWALMLDRQERKAAVVQPKQSDRLTWLKNKKQQAELQQKESFNLCSSWQSNMDKKDYSTKFDQVKEYILSGDCYQINLAQRFNAKYQGSEWQAYQMLAKTNAAPFSAFIRLEKSVVLSISPERFLFLADSEIETKPIKGTRPRNQDKDIDAANIAQLETSIKDRAENLMIVDLLRNDIGRVAQAGSVKVPKLFYVESFPAVHHLVSTVTATLSEKHSATDLLRACFPGGSITGAPKVRAMEIIEELEPHRRTVYCGSIGYISRCRKMDTSIAIRTLVCENNTIYAWAGGGLVMDSQVDAEHQEIYDKLNKILPLLAEFQGDSH